VGNDADRQQPREHNISVRLGKLLDLDVLMHGRHLELADDPVSPEAAPVPVLGRGHEEVGALARARRFVRVDPANSRAQHDSTQDVVEDTGDAPDHGRENRR